MTRFWGSYSKPEASEVMGSKEQDEDHLYDCEQVSPFGRLARKLFRCLVNLHKRQSFRMRSSDRECKTCQPVSQSMYDDDLLAWSCKERYHIKHEIWVKGK